jgi:hypothetical protein
MSNRSHSTVLRVRSLRGGKKMNSSPNIIVCASTVGTHLYVLFKILFLTTNETPTYFEITETLHRLHSTRDP